MWVIELLTTEAMTKKLTYWKEIFKECEMTIEAANDEMSLQNLLD